MPKNKSHKASLKRVRITRTGLVKHNRSFGKHLRSHKSSKRLRRLRTDKFMSNPEAKRLEKLLFRRLRGRDQARATLKRSPNPELRKKLQAEKREGLKTSAAKPAAVKKAATKTGVKAGVKAATKPGIKSAPKTSTKASAKA
mgnify:CR=1 FL=1